MCHWESRCSKQNIKFYLRQLRQSLLYLLLFLLDALLEAEQDAGGAPNDDDHANNDEGGHQDENEKSVIFLCLPAVDNFRNKYRMYKNNCSVWKVMKIYIVNLLIKNNFPAPAHPIPLPAFYL